MDGVVILKGLSYVKDHNNIQMAMLVYGQWPKLQHASNIMHQM